MTPISDKKENCNGCGVCKAVCDRKAVTMRRDDLGFYYPETDTERCVSCGKCRSRCPFANQSLPQNSPRDVLAVQSKETEILKRSQSGGLFAELSKSIIGLGGTVYGAAFRDSFEVCHIRIDSVNQIRKLQGSKYVQSKTEDIFRAVKDDLDRGVRVLFSGTPCQVAALYSYLGREYALLYTADIVCHGVTAPALWEDYLDFIKKQYGEITRADFRDKSFGWATHDETFLVGKRKIKKNVYRKIFYKNLLLRPCCYGIKNDRYITACKYAGMTRVSDITMGDFWGIKDETSFFKNKNLGISLCLINTPKGRRLFETIRQNVLWERHDIAETLARQPHLSCGGDEVPIREVYSARQRYIRKGFRSVASVYGENGVRGIYPKGIRFIKHIGNKIRKKTGFRTERSGKQ